MSFSCECDEYPEFYTTSTPRAAKIHYCGECWQEIKPGDTYVRHFSVYDGHPSTHKVCERCDDLMEAFANLGFCWYWGDFLSAYAEWLDLEGKQMPTWLQELREK